MRVCELHRMFQHTSRVCQRIRWEYPKATYKHWRKLLLLFETKLAFLAEQKQKIFHSFLKDNCSTIRNTDREKPYEHTKTHHTLHKQTPTKKYKAQHKKKV